MILTHDWTRFTKAVYCFVLLRWPFKDCYIKVNHVTDRHQKQHISCTLQYELPNPRLVETTILLWLRAHMRVHVPKTHFFISPILSCTFILWRSSCSWKFQLLCRKRCPFGKQQPMAQHRRLQRRTRLYLWGAKCSVSNQDLKWILGEYVNDVTSPPIVSTKVQIGVSRLSGGISRHPLSPQFIFLLVGGIPGNIPNEVVRADWGCQHFIGWNLEVGVCDWCPQADNLSAIGHTAFWAGYDVQKTIHKQ